MAKKNQIETGDVETIVWVKATFHFHVFHYRMPGTVAIASITPFVVSPLTVKMAMIAALLQRGDADNAENLVPYLPKIRVYAIPPKAAFSFKAFMRYRSVPAIESNKGLDEDGSYYPSRPHIREYALFQGDFDVLIGLPSEKLLSYVEKALQNIRYLGAKDSFTWCKSIEKIEVDEDIKKLAVEKLICSKEKGGTIALLDDFVEHAKITLSQIIPGFRKKEHYQHPKPYVLPGKIITRGRTRLFLRHDFFGQ